MMTLQTLTEAEQFSARFGDDGTNWIADDGEGFDEALADTAGFIEYGHLVLDTTGAVWATTVSKDRHIEGHPIRFEFPDGSAIVTAGDIWGIEGPERFSWRDA